MAIITDITNSNPLTQAILAGSQEAPSVKLPEQELEIDFCICDYTCEYVNNVFASVSETDDYKNDKTSFLVGLTDDSSSLSIVLVGTNDETVINNDTYGEYFAKGTFTNTDNQLNYVGFVADWKKILTLKGAGTYYFKFTETTFGQDFEKETIKYKLLPYLENFVYKTIRFKFIQNGLIENGLDYTGLNWTIQTRIKGSLKKLATTLEQDNYINNNRVVSQIQDKAIKNFEIETGLVNSDIGDLLENGILSNNILVSNYDWGAYKKYEDLPINITEVNEFKGNFELNPLGSFIFTAQERTQNTIKRNV